MISSQEITVHLIMSGEERAELLEDLLAIGATGEYEEGPIGQFYQALVDSEANDLKGA